MSPIELYLTSSPAFLPLVLCTGIAHALWLLRTRPTAPVLRWFTFMSIVAFVAATVTPTGADAPWGSSWNASWSFHIPRLSEFSSFNDAFVNIAITVPLGFFCSAWTPQRPLRSVGLLILLPLGVEVIQMVVPPLGRSGFLFEDVVNTWIGGAAGFVVGLLIWHFARAFSGASRNVAMH